MWENVMLVHTGRVALWIENAQVSRSNSKSVPFEVVVRIWRVAFRRGLGFGLRGSVRVISDHLAVG